MRKSIFDFIENSGERQKSIINHEYEPQSIEQSKRTKKIYRENFSDNY